MRYLYFIIFIFLIGCSKKEPKPELDYVNIDIVPSIGPAPSTIAINFVSKTITFTNLLQWALVPEDLNDSYYKASPKVDFEYIKLNEEEFNQIEKLMNTEFINFIIKENNELLKAPDKYYIGIFDGSYFKFDVVKNPQKLISTDYINIIDYKENCIKTIFNIIHKRTSSKNNKEYITLLYSDIK